MNVRIVFHAIIFLLTINQLSIAQKADLKFISIDGPDGKPIGKIRNMTQDLHGYMWFSGEGAECIYRYDGLRIISFRHDDTNANSLGGNYVGSVYADDAGIIWIGMVEGLDRFDPATGVFKHFRHNPNDPGSLSGGVNPILKDSKGRLWVGTSNGLDMLEEKTGKFIHYRNEPGNPRSLSSNTVVTIYEDRQGVIWIGANYPWDNKDPDVGGLNRLEPDGSFTRFMHNPTDPQSLINNKVGAIFEDSRGVFWVGTGGDGLHTMDRKTGRFERHTFDPTKPDKLSGPPRNKESFDIERIGFIQEDVTGSIWIGTMGSGLNRYDPLTKKITHYEGSNGFPDRSGWNAYQSRDGVLWISTQEDNLYRVDPFSRKIKSTPIASTPWWSLEDGENLWVGTEGGLLQYDTLGTLLKQFRHDPSDKHSLFDSTNYLITMFYDGGDTVWIGTGAGPGIFNKTTRQFSRLPITVKYKPNLPRNVPGIVKDSQGVLWFVLNQNGLLRYNPKDHSYKQYQHDVNDSTSLSSDRIVSVFEDKSGVIWVGDISGGVNRLDRKNETFKHYLKSIPCHQLFEDSEGILWMGTNAGPYQYHPREDKFLPFLEPESDVAYLKIININEDNERNLWMHNTSELVRLNRATKGTYMYSTNFGIEEYTITPLGFSKNPKGEFVLNHQRGLYTFYPEDIAVNVSPLKIILTDFFINALPVRPGNESVLKKSVEEVDELELAYNQNNISFNFAAIDYRSPERTKYFTRLDGYDSTWREVKGEKTVSYFSLPIGEFVFRVKAYNRDGTIGENVVTILIYPPWWQTWWAYMSYVLFFGMAVWFASKWRARNLQQQNKVLEEKVTQRTEALNQSLHELKSTQAQLIQSEKMASLGELTAGIAHEIQNPLNFVNNFSEVNKELLLEMKEEMEKGNLTNAEALANDVIDNQEKINHHGKRADAIVKGMLQHSRTSSGVKEPTDINALADEYLRLAYHGLRAKDKSFNASMNTDFDVSIKSINIIPQDIGRVILNLITNAFYAVDEKKKNPAGGQAGYEPTVSVSTKQNRGFVEIKVKDNGNGIPQRVLDKIFQPFFTTKPAGQGTGLGLSLSYDIVKAHGGEIKVNTLSAEAAAQAGNENEGTEFTITLPA